MCDLDLDVPNICIVYVTSVCYRTSFTVIAVGWISIIVRLPASLFEKEVNDLEACLHQPCLVNKWNGHDRMEHPVGSAILNFRIHNNGTLPTRMRSLFSWNVNNWRTFDSNEYKLRRCKRLLRKGPICLQETKSTGSEIEHP